MRLPPVCIVHPDEGWLLVTSMSRCVVVPPGEIFIVDSNVQFSITSQGCRYIRPLVPLYELFSVIRVFIVMSDVD